MRFGRMLVVKFSHRVGEGTKARRCFVCLCDCGVTKTVRLADLVAGKIVSCGCYGKEVSSRLLFKHGLKNTPEYTSYRGMLNRCYQKKHRSYYRYGGRGIGVCPQWRHDFLQFLKDMGPRPKGLSLDRINNEGNYEPNNCRWATAVEQARNRRKRSKKGAMCLLGRKVT